MKNFHLPLFLQKLNKEIYLPSFFIKLNKKFYLPIILVLFVVISTIAFFSAHLFENKRTENIFSNIFSSAYSSIFGGNSSSDIDNTISSNQNSNNQSSNNTTSIYSSYTAPITTNKPITFGDANYTNSWWANGIRDYSSTRRMNIMTGNYGISIDPYNLKIEKLGSFSTHVSREYAGSSTDNTIISSLPSHSLSLYAKVGSDVYKSSVADDGRSIGGPSTYNYRNIEVGRITQRFDIVNFSMSNGSKDIDAKGHLEVQAFYDYFSLIYELMPTSALSNVQMSFKWTLPSGYTNIKWQNGTVGSRAVCVTNSAGKGFTFVAPLLTNGTPKISISENEITFSQNPVNFNAPQGSINPLCEPWGNRKGINIYVIPSNNANVSDANRFFSMETGGITVSAQQKTTLQTTKTFNTVQYVSERGVYEINLNATKPNYNSLADRQMLDRVMVNIKNNTNTAQKVPIVLWRQDGFGTNAWLGVENGSIPIMREATNGFNGQGIPTGDFVQVTKNYHSNSLNLGSVLYEGMWLRYTSYVDVPANTTVSYDYSIAYATWGGVNAVSHTQLCLAGWGFYDLWTQLSLGTNVEQMTSEPETIETNGMLNDNRPLLVKGYGGLKYQLNDVAGGSSFLTYVTNKGQQFGKSVKTDFVKHGPNLSEVTYSWITADDAIQVFLKQNMGRTDDVSRIYFTAKFNVLKDTSFTRLALFQLGIDNYLDQADPYKAYGNELGATKFNLLPTAQLAKYNPNITNVDWTGSNRWIMSYGGPGLYYGAGGAVGTNRVTVLRDWKAKINGDSNAQPTLSSFGTKSKTSMPTNNWEITLPKGVNTLKKGDYIEMTLEFNLIPQYKNDYYGPQTDLISRILGSNENSWQSALFLAQSNKLIVNATVGSLKSIYPIKIEATNNSAQLTITNGVGYCPITFDGLSSNKGYVLEAKQPNGSFAEINQAVNGNDFWQCNFNADNNTYSITYNVFRDGTGATTEYRLRKT